MLNVSSSELVRSKLPCDDCGSTDALHEYSDGHTHCFSCRAHRNNALSGASRRTPRMSKDFLRGETTALPRRALSLDACRKFGIQIAQDGEDRVLVMNYTDHVSGEVVAQKTRDADKNFSIRGDAKRMGLFGQHLWPAKGRRVVVTEGELDAVAVCQADGLKWPAVSVPNGAQNARKAVAAAREWLEGYDEIVLAFDADEPGRKAAVECAGVLNPKKVRIADFGPCGFKDANEALMKADREGDPQIVKALLKALWDARPYRPDGIVSLADIRERVLKPVEMGFPWPWQGVTEATFGRRIGDVIGLGAASGCGKTDFVLQCITNDMRLGLTPGVLLLEQDVGETGKRLAGKLAERPLHVPDGSSSPEDLEAAYDALIASGDVHLFDSFGANDWETVRSKINYLIDVLGCRSIWLDHLTALAAAEADERQALEKIMAELAAIAKGRCILHFVSHLATPEGKPHEEGGRVQARHFKGSRAIIFWSHALYGLERNQQAEDEEERVTTTLRCLKDRHTGRATGMTWMMKYDRKTGMLNEHVGFDEEPSGGLDVTARAVGF